MTEAEWLTSGDASALLRSLPQPISRRRCLLAVCGYGRQIERLVPHASVVLHLAECERGADGLTTIDNSNEAMGDRIASVAAPFPRDSSQHLISVSLLECLFVAQLERPYIHTGSYRNLRTSAVNLMRIDPGNGQLGPRHHSDEWRARWEHECNAQADIVRDIFGNPLRPFALTSEWRTDIAVSLARQMYELRDFGAMPILADALQDAGCDNPDILDHCRGPGPHVRGCWVVDRVLGKE